ncbi:hypothetical protein CYMTET_55052 [Cymbomonas tetramitiformis]|uniref:Uncharacterized protein n=1 Tax=Cymbomonas tetramitiformis TaxID=36881 RepID=A0AAE0BE12_9CHLO|nr:hypothetical protein CYMTET_55052 [Cymbomonas tetramitiformis]
MPPRRRNVLFNNPENRRPRVSTASHHNIVGGVMPSTSPLSALAPEFTPRENGVVENAADDAVVPDLATSDLNMAPDLLARTMTEADMCDIRSVAADQQATDSIPPPSGNGEYRRVVATP